MPKKYTLFLLFCLIFTFSISSTAVAQSQKAVKGVVEPFFIQHNGKEILATNDMITYQNRNYVPITSIIEAFNGRITSTGSSINITIPKGSIQLWSSLEEKLPKETINPLNDKLLFQESVHAQAAAIIENHPNHIMFAKNGQEKLYPASTVKIMTALLALENGSLTDKIIVPHDITAIPFDSSKSHIRPGDKLTLNQLLYALMIPSGNDAAVAIAVHIAGSEQNFVKMMNEKAKEIGATNTNFMNSHGYHDPNQYTTAIDLAIISYEAKKIPEFLNYVSASSYTAIYEQKNGKIITQTWRATNQQIQKNSPYYAENILGGKTGFTSASRHTLVSFSTINNNDYITIILRGDRNQRYVDTQKMLKRAIALREAYDLEHKENLHILPITKEIYSDGRKVIIEKLTPPFIFSNRLYVPIETVSTIANKEVVLSDPFYKLAINQELVSFTGAQPQLLNGRLFVPARQVFNNLDVNFTYDHKTKQLLASNDKLDIKLTLNSKTVFINGEKSEINAAPFLEKGTIYIPARMIADIFDKSIDWGQGRTLIIRKHGEHGDGSSAS